MPNSEWDSPKLFPLLTRWKMDGEGLDFLLFQYCLRLENSICNPYNWTSCFSGQTCNSKNVTIKINPNSITNSTYFYSDLQVGIHVIASPINNSPMLGIISCFFNVNDSRTVVFPPKLFTIFIYIILIDKFRIKLHYFYVLTNFLSDSIFIVEISFIII